MAAPTKRAGPGPRRALTEDEILDAAAAGIRTSGEQAADLVMGVDVEPADGNTSVVILGAACWSGDRCGRAGPGWATSVAIRA
jgi:hypothetical protein